MEPLTIYFVSQNSEFTASKRERQAEENYVFDKDMTSLLPHTQKKEMYEDFVQCALHHPVGF